MSPLTTFSTAVSSLGANKLQTGLALLGIVIGVAAVISTMSVGRGAQEAVTANIQSLGTNLLFVRPWDANLGGFFGGQGSTTTLTLDDAEALLDLTFTPSVEAVAPELNTSGQIVAAGENTFAQVLGITPEYLSVRNNSMASGQFITPLHVENNSEVAVLAPTPRRRRIRPVAPGPCFPFLALRPASRERGDLGLLVRHHTGGLTRVRFRLWLAPWITPQVLHLYLVVEADVRVEVVDPVVHVHASDGPVDKNMWGVLLQDDLRDLGDHRLALHPVLLPLLLHEEILDPGIGPAAAVGEGVLHIHPGDEDPAQHHTRAKMSF